MTIDPNASPAVPAAPVRGRRGLIIAAILNLVLAALFLTVINKVLSTNDTDVIVTWATMELSFIAAPIYVFYMLKKGKNDFFITFVAWVPVAIGFYRMFVA